MTTLSFYNFNSNSKFNFNNIRFTDEVKKNSPELIGQFEHSCEKGFPRYTSWAGFNKWVDTIVAEMPHINEKQAAVMLLHPNEDIDWVLELKEDVVDDVLRIHPFADRIPPSTVIKEWISVWRDKGFYIKTFIEWGSVIKPLGLKRPWQLRKVKEVVDFLMYSDGIPFRDIIPVIHKLLWIKWWKYSATELASFIKEGIITPSCGEIVRKVGFVPPKEILSEIKIEYLEKGDYSINDIIKAGVKHKTLAKVWGVSIKTIMGMGDATFTYALPIPNYVAVMYPKMEVAWVHYIKDRKVADWAWEKRAQLAKTRVIHGPGGSVATLHYHTLLREVKPQMLVNGVKTSWKKVMSSLEEVAKRKIEAQLGTNVPLPEIKGIDHVNKKHGVIPIKNSHALREEGNKMNHCVGSYIQACLAGKSFIFHIGNVAPKGATFEIIKEGGKYKMTQCFGSSNSDPKPEDNNKAIKWLEEVNTTL